MQGPVSWGKRVFWKRVGERFFWQSRAFQTTTEFGAASAAAPGTSSIVAARRYYEMMSYVPPVRREPIVRVTAEDVTAQTDIVFSRIDRPTL